jgi:AcrR family transcriptional regulator
MARVAVKTTRKPGRSEVFLVPAEMRQEAGDLGPRAHRTIERILDAARHVFLVSGYNGTTIDGIARVANMSRASVYTYFPSKRDIMLATGARSASETEVIIDTLAELGATRAGVGEWVTSYMTHLDKYGSFIFAWTQAAHEDPELLEAGMKRHLRLCQRTGQALADAQGRVIDDPRALGLVVSSLFERSWSYGALYGDSVNSDHLEATIADMVWSIIRGLDRDPAR